MRNRVRQHKSQAYRARYPTVMHYRAYDAPGRTPHIFPLVVFSTRVPMALVVCAEATMMALFSTLRKPGYSAARPRTLPKVPITAALNRSDPLGTGSGQAVVMELHLRHLENMLFLADEGIPRHVHGRDQQWNKFWWNLCQVPMYTAAPEAEILGLNLEERPTIYVRFELADERHPNLFAPQCSDQDDGRRMAVELYRHVNGELKRCWTTKQSKIAHKTANSIHDWLEGRITDPATHVWPESRRPFCGPVAVVRAARKAMPQISEGTATRHQDRKASGMAQSPFDDRPISMGPRRHIQAVVWEHARKRRRGQQPAPDWNFWLQSRDSTAMLTTRAKERHEYLLHGAEEGIPRHVTQENKYH